MAGLSDLLARQAAAGGLMREASNPDAGLPPEAGLPEETVPEPGAPDLESALAGVEAAVEQMDPKIAEEVRQHVNAIREIASKDVGPALAEQAPPEAGEAPEEPRIPA